MSFQYSRVGSKDSNHDEVRNLYESMGCSVYEVNRVPGFVDLVVGCVGRTELVEVKTEDGKLSPKQKVFARDWRGGKPRLVRGMGDVMDHVRDMRRGAK